jgi:hypothetical protein
MRGLELLYKPKKCVLACFREEEDKTVELVFEMSRSMDSSQEIYINLLE